MPARQFCLTTILTARVPGAEISNQATNWGWNFEKARSHLFPVPLQYNETSHKVPGKEWSVSFCDLKTSTYATSLYSHEQTYPSTWERKGGRTRATPKVSKHGQQYLGCPQSQQFYWQSRRSLKKVIKIKAKPNSLGNPILRVPNLRSVSSNRS